MVESQGPGLQLKEIPNGMNYDFYKSFVLNDFVGLLMLLIILEMERDSKRLFLIKKFPWQFVSLYFEKTLWAFFLGMFLCDNFPGKSIFPNGNCIFQSSTVSVSIVWWQNTV